MVAISLPQLEGTKRKFYGVCVGRDSGVNASRLFLVITFNDMKQNDFNSTQNGI